MAHDERLWVVTMGTALHVLDEHSMDWKAWAEQALGLRVSWADFYVTNAAMLVAAVAGAHIGWRLPSVSLSVPALTVINALGLHLGPTVRQRRYAPGTVTALLVYLPAAAWAYEGARRDGVLTAGVAIRSLLGGALLMAFPLGLARYKQARPRASG